MTEPQGDTNLYAVGGNVQASAGEYIYIERAADEQMLSLCRRSAYAYILSSRQIGKSSLMVRTAERLNAEGMRTATIDLSGFGKGDTAEQWYFGLLQTLVDELGLKADPAAWWHGHANLGFTHRLTRFFEEVLLDEVSEPVVVFVDEIDLTRRLTFAGDFFAAVRYLFQSRPKKSALRRLSFVLIGAATPDNLINDPLATPFTIAQRVDLSDFTYREALPLACGFGLPQAEARQVLKWILKWTGGHPFLTQYLCRCVAAARRARWEEARVDKMVVKEFSGERWKQESHFMTICDMLNGPKLKEVYGLTPHDALSAYKEILAGGKPVRDEENSPVKSHLKMSGLVQRKGNALAVRNMTYCRVFNLKWVQSNLAGARQQAAAETQTPAAPLTRDPAPRQQPAAAAGRRPRVFISYKRDVRPDEPVAERVTKALKRSHDVFIDQKMPVGTKWGERIESELHQADFLISFLSARSVRSEMVESEIATAHRLAKKRRRSGRPVILPVRLAYTKPFHYPLSAYLDRVSWAFWKSHDDTPRLIKEIKRALSEGELTIKGVNSKAELIENGHQEPLPAPLPSAQPRRLEVPGGTVAADSDFYVERPSDAVALGEMVRQGATVTIKGPRQMGKSSLLMRVIAAAERAGKRAIFLDFQLVDRAILSKSGLFFRHFCRWLTEKLGFKDLTGEYWKGGQGGGDALRCTRYVSRYLLGQIDRPLVLAMDEVDSVLDTDYRSDFFGMLRSWHDARRSSGSAWRKLDIVLVTSTEPHMLIDNVRQSPFNVGRVVELGDFTPAQVEDLNRRHRLGRKPPFNQPELRRLYELLHGHPYLVRRALYLVASRALTPAALFDTAAAEDGPFADHLCYYLYRLQANEKLIGALRQVIFENRCGDAESFSRLKAAGLVRAEGRRVVPRCKLYADYLREHLDV